MHEYDQKENPVLHTSGSRLKPTPEKPPNPPAKKFIPSAEDDPLVHLAYGLNEEEAALHAALVQTHGKLPGIHDAAVDTVLDSTKAK